MLINKIYLAIIVILLTVQSAFSVYYDFSYNYEAKEPKSAYHYTSILPPRQSYNYNNISPPKQGYANKFNPSREYPKLKVAKEEYKIVFPPRREENLALRYFNLFLSNPYERETPDGNTEIYSRYKPNLTAIAEKCPRDAFFGSYNPSHRGAVSALSSLYNDQSDFRSLIQLSQFFKTQLEVHPAVWYTSLIRGQLSRMPETLQLQRPSPINLFPSNFFPETLMKETTPSPLECIVLDEQYGQDNGIENLLWYFREDVQMNAHHWIWHLIFPVNSTEQIPRRGEFFYFFHHELVARYGAERIANGLPPQKPLNLQINSVVEEGYNPHLMNGISTQPWAARPPRQNLATALSATIFGDLVNLTIRRDRVLESLLAGSVLRGDRDIPIHTFDNINIVGELSEASNHSINPLFYGMDGYHNDGHVILASLIGNSPPGTIGVMGDVATAMRDPIFYRWHRLVDTLFVTYKTTHLTPYKLSEGENPLIFRGVAVTDIRVIPNDKAGGVTNVLRTFWNSRRWNLAGGLDFNSRDGAKPPNVNICAKHLDHEEFTYNIQIESYHPAATLATVRIFMAPRFKTNKEKQRFTMAEQRIRFFSLDSFVTTLEPGRNFISRRSTDSTLTAPWPMSIEQLRQEINAGVRSRTDCECGFPHHLLLPKGTPEGMTFDLFVMVTDGAVDQVVEPPRPQQNLNIPQCTPSHIHCGILGSSYPDSRPMGYPFDRRPYSVPTVVKLPSGQMEIKNVPVSSLEEYVSHVPNMATTKVVVLHQNIQLGLEGYRKAI